MDFFVGAIVGAGDGLGGVLGGGLGLDGPDTLTTLSHMAFDGFFRLGKIRGCIGIRETWSRGVLFSLDGFKPCDLDWKAYRSV